MVSPDARSPAWVSFDGRRRQQLEKNDVLMISTSKYPLPSLCKQNPINDWFGSLAGCLHWNVRKTQSNFNLPFSSDNNTSNSESGESINGHWRISFPRIYLFGCQPRHLMCIANISWTNNENMIVLYFSNLFCKISVLSLLIIFMLILFQLPIISACFLCLFHSGCPQSLIG